MRNDGLSITAGRSSGAKPALGGSDPSTPSFFRTGLVEYNTVNKSRDLGRLNNFSGKFSGFIGGQTGSPTIYFKVETIGAADLRVTKNAINKYTDGYISVNVLNADHKLVEVNDFGFAYNNEVVNTEKKESVSSLPAGIYYFTVSTNQWQSIPYSINIQAIRFIGIEGPAIISAGLRDASLSPRCVVQQLGRLPSSRQFHPSTRSNKLLARRFFLRAQGAHLLFHPVLLLVDFCLAVDSSKHTHTRLALLPRALCLV